MQHYQKLYDDILSFIKERYDGAPDNGAAGVILENDEIIISTSPDYYNNGVSVCEETGAFLEAYKRDLKIKATMCLYRDEQKGVIVLPPCGVCLERLRDHGTDILAAVPQEKDFSLFEMKPIDELMPIDWSRPFLKN